MESNISHESPETRCSSSVVQIIGSLVRDSIAYSKLLLTDATDVAQPRATYRKIEKGLRSRI